MASAEEFTLYAPPDEMLELAKACLVGLSANFEAPHHKPRELAARAFDYAQAFYDELDARTAAAEARESEAPATEPPPSSLLSPLTHEDEIDEDPADEPEPSIDQPPSTTEALRPWSGDVDRAPQS